MPNERETQQPTIVLAGLCYTHRPRETYVTQAKDDQERVMDILLCGRCWRLDPGTLLRLCESLELSGEDIEIVQNHALSKL